MEKEKLVVGDQRDLIAGGQSPGRHHEVTEVSSRE